MRTFPAIKPLEPSRLPAAHPLARLIDTVEAAGGTVAAGPGTLGASGEHAPVPTVLVALGEAEWTGQAPTYRQAAALLESSIVDYITRKDL